MFVILEGQFQWRGEFGGETSYFRLKAGDVTGVLPFSRMKQFTVTGRAVTDGRVLRFPVVDVSRTCAENAGADHSAWWA